MIHAVDPSLSAAAAIVLQSIGARGWTVGTAESCTGGLIAGALTAVPGSSAVVAGGVVTYTNGLKHQLLGVPRHLFEQVGAVSAEVAAAMATGACERLGVDLAIAATGIAGPGGATATKPVGLVWLGLASPAGLWTRRCVFPGDRDAIRLDTVRAALTWLRQACAG